MNAVFLSVIVEKTGYERWQTESKLKILTKVLQFMLVAIFFFSFFFSSFFFFFSQILRIICVHQTPPTLFLRRGGVCTPSTIGEKDQNDRNAIERFTSSVE